MAADVKIGDVLVTTAQAAAEYLQTMPTAVLAAARRGEIDLHALAAQTLADRGLDHDGRWVGFQRARLLATLHPVHDGTGAIRWVSVPDSDEESR